MIYHLTYKGETLILNTHHKNELVLLIALRRCSDCKVLEVEKLGA